MTQDNANHDAVPAATAPVDRLVRLGATDCESVGTDKAEPLTRDCGTGNTDARLAALEELSALDQKLELEYGLTGNPMIKARPCKAAKKDTTQPRNGTPAQGSVQGEGSVRDSRNAKEPVAWAVETGGELEASFCGPAGREDAADWREQSDGVIVPLYRHPQPTFTDEEWEAVDRLMRDYQAAGLALDANVAATLRGLLERMK